MTSPLTPEQKRSTAWLLIVLGGSMVVLCGGCTLAFWTAELTGLGIPLADDLTPYELTALVIGVLPTVVGGLVAWRGLRDLNAADPPPRPPE